MKERQSASAAFCGSESAPEECRLEGRIPVNGSLASDWQNDVDQQCRPPACTFERKVQPKTDVLLAISAQ